MVVHQSLLSSGNRVAAKTVAEHSAQAALDSMPLFLDVETLNRRCANNVMGI